MDGSMYLLKNHHMFWDRSIRLAIYHFDYLNTTLSLRAPGTLAQKLSLLKFSSHEILLAYAGSPTVRFGTGCKLPFFPLYYHRLDYCVGSSNAYIYPGRLMQSMVYRLG